MDEQLQERFERIAGRFEQVYKDMSERWHRFMPAWAEVQGQVIEMRTELREIKRRLDEPLGVDELADDIGELDTRVGKAIYAAEQRLTKLEEIVDTIKRLVYGAVALVLTAALLTGLGLILKRAVGA